MTTRPRQRGRVPTCGPAVVVQAPHLGADQRRALRRGERGSRVGARTVGHPDVSVLYRQVHAPAAGGGDGERHPRLLHATGLVRRRLSAVVLPGHRGGGSPQDEIEQGDEFLEVIGPLRRGPRRLAEDGGVPALAAGPQPGREPAVGQVIERDQLPGEGHGMTEVGGGHERAEPHRRRGERGCGEGRHRGEPSGIAQHPPGDVVIGPGVVEPHRLCPRPQLRPLGPPVLREDHHTEPHPPEATTCPPSQRHAACLA